MPKIPEYCYIYMERGTYEMVRRSTKNCRVRLIGAEKTRLVGTSQIRPLAPNEEAPEPVFPIVKSSYWWGNRGGMIRAAADFGLPPERVIQKENGSWGFHIVESDGIRRDRTDEIYQHWENGFYGL